MGQYASLGIVFIAIMIAYGKDTEGDYELVPSVQLDYGTFHSLLVFGDQDSTDLKFQKYPHEKKEIEFYIFDEPSSTY